MYARTTHPTTYWQLGERFAACPSGTGENEAGLVDRPFDEWRNSVVGRRNDAPKSAVRLRTLPSIMLVQIEPEEEPPELALDQLRVRVLRVRYPLPASVRMFVVRPLVVIIGAAVVERDLAFVFRAADETCAATLQLGSLVARSALGSWLRRAIETMEVRRRERDR